MKGGYNRTMFDVDRLLTFPNISSYAKISIDGPLIHTIFHRITGSRTEHFLDQSQKASTNRGNYISIRVCEPS